MPVRNAPFSPWKVPSVTNEEQFSAQGGSTYLLYHRLNDSFRFDTTTALGIQPPGWADRGVVPGFYSVSGLRERRRASRRWANIGWGHWNAVTWLNNLGTGTIHVGSDKNRTYTLDSAWVRRINGWQQAKQPNLTRETQVSGTSGDGKKLISTFPRLLTSKTIGNLTRFMPNVVKVMTINTHVVFLSKERQQAMTNQQTSFIHYKQKSAWSSSYVYFIWCGTVHSNVLTCM